MTAQELYEALAQAGPEYRVIVNPGQNRSVYRDIEKVEVWNDEVIIHLKDD